MTARRIVHPVKNHVVLASSQEGQSKQSLENNQSSSAGKLMPDGQEFGWLVACFGCFSSLRLLTTNDDRQKEGACVSTHRPVVRFIQNHS